jgi:LysR family nitrogen assimilation transcriptional regulator
MPDAPPEIRLFVAAFEERSFTGAARREHATQSGVSQHIRKLEDRFGVKLFARNSGAIAPTPAGEAFYRECVAVLRAHAAAVQALRGFTGSLEGEIVVGLMPSMTRCALAPSLARFMTLHPNVQVHIVEAYSGALTERVRAGELEFAVVPAGRTGPGVSSRVFCHTPEVLVAGHAHGLAHGAPVRLRDLGPVRLVLPGAQNARRQSLEAYLSANAIEVAQILELDAMLGALDLVARTDWLTIVPGVMMASEEAGARWTVGKLADPSLSVDLMLIEPAKRVLSPAAAAFLKVLEEETARVDAVWGEAS